MLLKISIACGLIAFAMLNAAYAIETHTKLWTTAAFTGSLSSDKKIKYYLEPEVRFIDDKYKFSSVLFWAGLGYQVTPNFSVFAGDATSVLRNLSGEYIHENFVWQRANVAFIETVNTRLDNRLQLEERKKSQYAQWAITLRERLMLRLAIQEWSKHFLVLSDEVFFNLKHPDWVNSNSFISQNRALIGIETRYTQSTSLLVGYMNQYDFTNTNQLSNILFVGVTVNTG
jgi:hypothetical protein